MTPAEIRAYQYNVEFTDKSVTPLALGTEEALSRQAEAVRTVSLAAGADAGLLAHLSLEMSTNTRRPPTVTICSNGDGSPTRWTLGCRSISPPCLMSLYRRPGP